jgi:hypothetical protein
VILPEVAMRRPAFAVALIATLACQTAWADAPADLMTRIYRHYTDPASGVPSPYDDTTLPSKRLKALFDAYDQNSSPELVGALDFDPYIGAQDYEIKNFRITSEMIAGDTATIGVEFMNFDYETELTYSLVRESGAWKVDDIQSMNPDDPWVLSKLLKGE